MTHARLAALALAAALTTTCGGNNSPAAPTPTPAPALVLTATGDWPSSRPDSAAATGNGNALGVAAAPEITGTDGKDAGAAWIAIKASGSSIGQVRGSLLYDQNLLSFDVYSEGPWFKQGGALVTWTLLVNTPGQIGFQLDRPTTLPAATGTGTVIYIRLRGKTKGTSALQWSSPELRGTDLADRPLTGGSFGGSVTIR